MVSFLCFATRELMYFNNKMFFLIACILSYIDDIKMLSFFRVLYFMIHTKKYILLLGPSKKDVRKIWPFFDPPLPPVSAYFGLLQVKINNSVRIWQTPLPLDADVLYGWPLRFRVQKYLGFDPWRHSEPFIWEIGTPDKAP